MLFYLEGSRAGVPVIFVLELQGVSAADVHGARGPTTAPAATPISEAGELIPPAVVAEPWRVSVAKTRIWRDRPLA